MFGNVCNLSEMICRSNRHSGGLLMLNIEQVFKYFPFRMTGIKIQIERAIEMSRLENIWHHKDFFRSLLVLHPAL